jgi:hypothetical protein
MEGLKGLCPKKKGQSQTVAVSEFVVDSEELVVGSVT